MTRDYQLGGLRLRVSSEEPALVEALQARLRRLAAPAPGPADLQVELCSADALAAQPLPAGPARTVYDPPFGEVVYFPAAGSLVIRYGERVHARCDPGAGRGWIGVGAGGASAWNATHPIFTVFLIELLRWRGYYALHAAGLCRDGHALLLPGGRGAGKSTLTLALLRAGFGLLGDDTCFLHAAEPGRRCAVGFPDELDVTEATVGFFPELRFLLRRGRPAGATKRQLLPEEVYAVDFVASAEPAALVFPRVTGLPRSRLEAIPPDQALLELVPNILLTDADVSHAHLRAISDLLGDCPCYRLWTGQDFDVLPELLGEVLTPVAAG